MRIPALTRKALLLSALLLTLATAVSAQEDPCSPFEGNLDDYLDALTTRLSGQARADLGQEATELALMSRANSDGLSGGRLDLLRRAFVALDLGEVKEEEGKLIFNFNPDMLKLGEIGQFSPRVIVHEAALFTALAENIDADNTIAAAERTARKDALDKSLQDLDDVEVHLRWTNANDTPEAEIGLASRIFTAAYQGATQAAAQNISELGAEFNQDLKAALAKTLAATAATAGTLPINTICVNPTAAAHLRQLATQLEVQVPELIKGLREELAASAFFDIADLIEGQPRFTAEGSYRAREGAAGPNTWSLNLRYEIGAISLDGFNRWAAARNQQRDAVGLESYLDDKSKLQSLLPKFSLTAEYSESSDFEIAIPGKTDPFRQPDSQKLSSKLQAGWYFGGGRDRRLELEGTYDDVSDDPNRRDRFVSTLSWVESLNPRLAQLAGGSELVVSFVYANKPEFRGEVDEDFGLRAGLKWSLGPKNETSK